jgi:hypothetical protein
MYSATFMGIIPGLANGGDERSLPPRWQFDPQTIEVLGMQAETHARRESRVREDSGGRKP